MVTGSVTIHGKGQGTNHSTNQDSDPNSVSLSLKAGAVSGGGRAVLTAP